MLDIKSDFNKFKKVFILENSKINLVSKNDENNLFEKHFYDSLAIKLFFDKYCCKPKTILDIGTGGGFPAIPIAMEYPDIDVFAIDSITKKIRAVRNIADNLCLPNITLINDRVENLKDYKFDIVVSRAVAKIDKLVEYSVPLLNDGGYLVLYKSVLADEEIDSAKNIIRKSHMQILPKIEYRLPLKENHTRCLIVLKK